VNIRREAQGLIHPTSFELSSFVNILAKNGPKEQDFLTLLNLFIFLPVLQFGIRKSLLKMDAAIDLSDASKALDLSNIRFQLM